MLLRLLLRRSSAHKGEVFYRFVAPLTGPMTADEAVEALLRTLQRTVT